MAIRERRSWNSLGRRMRNPHRRDHTLADMTSTGTTGRGGSLSIAAMVTGCLVIVAAFLHAGEEDLRFFFMADTLYLPSIHRDVVVEGNSLWEWSLNSAPNFFPDMALYFMLNGLVDRFTIASYAFPIVQFVIIAVLFRVTVRQAGVRDDGTGHALGVLLLALIAMMGAWGNDFRFAFHMLVNSFHGGAFVNALICTWLLLRSFVAHGPWTILPLGLFTVLAAASDKLFWVMFSMPAVIICGLLATRAQVRWRMLPIGVLIAGCTWLANCGLDRLDEALPLTIERPYAYQAFDRITSSWSHFLEMLRVYLSGSPLVAGCIVLGLVTTGWAMVYAALELRTWFHSLRGDSRATDLRPIAARWMVGMFLPFVLFAPVLNGSFDGPDSLRYNFAVFMLASLIAGVALSQWTGRFSAWLATAGLVIVGLPALWTCVTAGEGYRRIAMYKPERVREMDRLARDLGLRNGVANYWDAKVITMFSDEGLVVLPVFPDLAMYIHVNREDMFRREGPGNEGSRMFDHIVLHPELPKEGMMRLFGQDTGFHASGGVEVMLTPPWAFEPGARLPALPPQ